MVVQLVPLALFEAVTTFPARTSRIQILGAVPELLLVLLTLPLAFMLRPAFAEHATEL